MRSWCSALPGGGIILMPLVVLLPGLGDDEDEASVEDVRVGDDVLVGF